MEKAQQNKTVESIKKERDNKINELLNKVQVFWAFSNEQFEKNKPELKPGDKFSCIGSGGYIPKSNLFDYNEGYDAISSWYYREIRKNNLLDKLIMHEICNYECFYSDLSIIYDMFPDTPKDYILKLYKKVLERVEL